MTGKYPSVAIITANIGGFDRIIRPVGQMLPFHYHVFTEANFPVQLNGSSNRMKSKYPKMQAHNIFPQYDIFIWIDARVRVISRRFIFNYIQLLQQCDIVTTTHPDRKNIRTEFYFMLSEMSAGNRYLLDRYNVADLNKQIDFLIENKLPDEFPLFSAGISARWNNEKVNAMMDDWWEHTQQFGDYDQALYSYFIWKHQLNYRTVNFHNPFFKLANHANENSHIHRAAPLL